MSSGLQSNSNRGEPNLQAAIHNIYSDNSVRDAFRHSFYNNGNGKASPALPETKTKVSRNNPDLHSKESKRSNNSSRYSYAKLSRNSSQNASKNSNKNAFDEY
jgi:hypothetical protein